MKSNHRQTKFIGMLIRQLVAIVCIALLVFPAGHLVAGESKSLPAAGQQQTAPPISADQLDALVAPIALYPDPMLSQTLVAATYPLEIVQLQQWLSRNPGLKDKALADAVAKQPWDPSIQAMAALPDLVKRLADDIQWATDLGNAFLAQQSDVMNAVQRMRKKAQDKGALKSNEHQKVEVQVVESKPVIVIEQPNPQVVYVPSYDPVVVYGPPIYPYPPIYYPPYYPGAALVGFGVGLAIGAAWGGGWGWGCGWGNNEININNNNNFNRNTNINGGNRNQINPNRGGNNKWQHNPQHRGGAPYRDKGTADRFGGAARGDSLAKRQSGARQQIGRQGGNLASTRPSGGANGGARPSTRPSGGASNGARPGGGANSGARPSTRPSGGAGGGDRVGNRSISKPTGGNKGGFGTGGFNPSSTRSSSSRGSSSMGGSRGGGGGRSGGGGGRRR